MASLSSWIAALNAKRIKAKTIKAYLTGVKSTHVDLGYEGLEVVHSPQLERIIAGVRRLRGEAGTKERCPLTKDKLLSLLPQFDQSTKEGSTMHAAFCLAFAAFLRIGEFTYPMRDRQDEAFSKWFLTRRITPN
ncbi:hypothetical protein HO173_003272 [Letharia columbiana]|uniref:Integrase SAM-like N-terminal domain-containing protein n=1 Tax=Letharia columbiana TaxID=112416 RepID=A0A8H6G1T3_9LECA|nr:uncharacterized protein HO173_003272 [Letharia columbiana]KAF6238765.1 hypothetical protein HO173_003272 [Letharia columbiana]